MTFFQLRKSMLIAAVFAAVFPASAWAQLGLSQFDRSDADYRKRAARFMTNRSAAQTYRERIRSNTILFGRDVFMSTRNRRPLIMDPQFGLFTRPIAPTDRAGLGLRQYRLFDLQSQIANYSIDLPQATDYFNEDELGWTTEEVLTALRRHRSTATLALAEPAPELGTGGRMERKLDSKADEYYKVCAAKFREALQEKDRKKRSQLMAEARSRCDIVMQLDIDNPRGYLANAIIAYDSQEFNTALVSLELGIRRAKTLDALRIDRTAFFGDSPKWDRMVEQVNLTAQSSDNPRVLILKAYLAFLNNELDNARTAADQAARELKTRMRKATKEDEAAEEIAGYSSETSVTYAEHFRDLLDEKLEPRKTAANP